MFCILSLLLCMQGLSSEYLLVTPDRSLVFTAMDYFMSTVRKASVLHPGAPVVIDLSYVSIADFTTAYVRFYTLLNAIWKFLLIV